MPLADKRLQKMAVVHKVAKYALLQWLATECSCTVALVICSLGSFIAAKVKVQPHQLVQPKENPWQPSH